MDAMTMSYPVDKPDVLKKVKVGDTIMATVYKGDTTLHDVMVMPLASRATRNRNEPSKRCSTSCIAFPLSATSQKISCN